MYDFQPFSFPAKSKSGSPPPWWRLEAKLSSFDTEDVNFRYQWPEPYIIYDFQPFPFPAKSCSCASLFDGAWKPNAAALTRVTFISVISDPNLKICTIFSLFHFQLKVVVFQPLPPLMTPGSQTQQFWPVRRSFPLSVTRTLQYVWFSAFFHLQLKVVAARPLWWLLKAKRCSFDTVDVHFRYQWPEPYNMYDFQIFSFAAKSCSWAPPLMAPESQTLQFWHGRRSFPSMGHLKLHFGQV